MTADTKAIRLLNDKLRQSFSGGKVVVTAAVAALPSTEQAAIMTAARLFNAFTEDNDPYGEHDCAMFDAAGHRCMFKIDYYDATMEFGSEDPADPSKTTRVLTIMLREDY